MRSRLERAHRRRTGAGRGALVLVALRAEDPDALYRQIYSELRQRILEGHLQRGARLPSTRSLSLDLHVSRSTVVQAYQQLSAEGYIESVGRGATRVSPTLPDPLTRADAPRGARPSPRVLCGPSARGDAILRAAAGVPWLSARPPRAFRTSVPALDVFPVEIWGRLVSRAWRRSKPSSLGYGDPRGAEALRHAISDYLTSARGVRCHPDQVLVTSGSQQGLDIVARVLLDPGDRVWMEDPGYWGATGAFVAAGARVVPVPVDADGIQVDAGIARAPRARLAFVTPARQLPLGVTMALGRRLALLSWAAKSRAWILEDDYDSEFRYLTRPVASLQGIDKEGCVILMGTFSKVMFPAMRLGYLVVPESLMEAFTAARRMLDLCPAEMTQMVMAEFMVEGHFERHIRRMRAIYRARRQLLVKLLKRDLAGLVGVDAPDAGMNLIVWLPPGSDDREVSEALAAAEVDAMPLSAWTLRRSMAPGLLLGYSGVREADLREGVKRLRTVLEGCRKGPARAPRRPPRS